MLYAPVVIYTVLRLVFSYFKLPINTNKFFLSWFAVPITGQVQFRLEEVSDEANPRHCRRYELQVTNVSSGAIEVTFRIKLGIDKNVINDSVGRIVSHCNIIRNLGEFRPLWAIVVLSGI